MRNRLVILLCLLLIPFSVHAEDFTYEDAQEAIRQSMQAWYMRGSYRQYNSSKNTYEVLRHPEDSTVQDNGYSVCSGFSNDAIMEAFGFKSNNDGVPGAYTPAGSSAYINEAKFYLYGNPEKNVVGKECKTLKPSSGDPKVGCRGEYVIYYYNEDLDKDPYYYNPNKLELSNIKKLSNFLKVLRPGDIVSYDGHVLLVYDFKYSDGKKVDALLVESGTGGSKVMTKIDPTETKLHQLYYRKSKNNTDGVVTKNGILDIVSAYMPYEGTLHWRWLSKYKKFVNDGIVACTTNMCSITRAFYKGSDGKAVFNYDIVWPENQRTSKARLHLPGIFIAKTSSKYDNNSVVLNDPITYTIRIINNSNLSVINGTSKKTTYKNFYVKETLPPEVDYVASSIDDSQEGTYDANTRTITWKITKLEPTQEIVLKYKVKVKNDTANIGKFINAEGKVYVIDENYALDENYFIKTSTVRHEIINTTSKTDAEYRTCYNSLKSKHSSLSLIQKTYECVYGEDLPFSFTKFSPSNEDYLNKMMSVPSGKASQVQLNTAGDYKIYADMILNNYWNKLTKNTKNSTTYYTFPSWRGKNTGNYISGINRANTIASGHFKVGDVLIYTMDKKSTKDDLCYTKENGIYAYIYLTDANGENGKFVGVNYKDNSNKRNEFTKEYYTNNNLALGTYLYDGPATDANYNYANYQTLFGKDAYVILRPEKVITEITKITVKTNPTKTTYLQKETLDVTGGVITATKSNGDTEDISMKDSSVSITGYDANKVGEQTITVTYKGKSTSFQVTVNANTITSISVKTNPTKTNYFVGEELSVAGGIIKVTYSNNSTKDISMSNSEVSISGYNQNTAGNQTIQVAYQEKTTSFTVVVTAVELQSIHIGQYPDKLIYQVGESLNLTGGEILKTYNNGMTSNVDMTDQSVTVTGFDSATAGTKTVTLTVGGKSATMEIIVNSAPDPTEVRTLDSISIYSNPNKTSYLIGEELELTGGKIKAKYNKTVGDTTTIEYEIIDMSNSNVTVSGFSSTEEGNKTITVKYQEKTTSFTVTVSKAEVKIQKIEVTQVPSQRNYKQYQENLNLNGGKITVTKSDNSTEEIEMTNSEITVLDFDNSILGNQTLRVLYKGFETTFKVTIYDQEEEPEEEYDIGTVTSAEIIQQPEITTYVQGDSFDVSGMVLKLQYDDGETSTVELADYPGQYTVSGFDSSKVGEQTVTIQFAGQDVQVLVTVRAREDIVAPDTFATKGFFSKIIATILLISGFMIMMKYTSKKNS